MPSILANILSDFHFMHPGWLWLLLMVPLLWLWAVLRREREGTWSELVDEELAPFVLTGRSRKQRYRAVTMMSLLITIATLAMAGPSWEKREIPAFRTQQSLVVGLDLSASMYVRDAVPNRLDAARFKLLDLLRLRKEGQTSLVVFAGDAFVVSPLTDDTSTIEAQVKNLSPEVMPVQGSHIDLAILRAIDVLEQTTPGEGSILLITDGTNDVRLAREAAQQAVSKGYTVSIMAIGTEEGAPLPLTDGSFMTDSTGIPIMPRLDKAALQAIVKAGAGVFTLASVNDRDINKLLKHWSVSVGVEKQMDEQERQLDVWFNQGIWLVLLLLPLAMLLFRRGWLTVWLGAGIMPLLLLNPQSVQASVWNDLWLTPDQQGQRALQQGDATAASELFRDRNWQAAAAYKAGDYAKAATLYAQDDSVAGLYNYGNALALQGKLSQAIAAYEAVLEREPDHEDARHNLEQLKKQQEQQQQQQGQQNGQNNGSQQQSGGQQSDNAEGESARSGDEEQADPMDAQQQAEASGQEEQNSEGEKQSESEQEAAGEMDAQTREQKQATEQWLRLIPDDPARLWRRKFRYQYRQRTGGNGQQSSQGDSW